MRCFCCGDPVSTEMHEEVQELLDEDCEKDVQGDPTSLVNVLGLVHCTGLAGTFDDEGRVVVCSNCIDGASCDAAVTLDDTATEVAG